MKKLCRRILLLSAMFVLLMTVHASADSRVYSARTVTYPNQNSNAGWSNQFTVSVKTNVAVAVKISGVRNVSANYTYTLSSGYKASDADNINNHLMYLLENVKTHEKYYLTDIDYTALEYTVHMTVPAGTYSLGVYYTGSFKSNYAHGFNLYFSVSGNSGIKIPDSIEIMAGTKEVVTVSQENVTGGFVPVKSYGSSDLSVADVVNINNDVTPPQITVEGKTANKTAVITVYGTDGSSDQMTVKVVPYVASPTLLYNDLTLSYGEIVYNEVLNTDAAVKWSSANTNVVKVAGDGKMTAVGSGTTTVTAKTTVNGKEYSLDCKIEVLSSDPEFIIKLTSINLEKGRVKVSITNESGVDMTVFSAGAMLLNFPDYTQIRVLKMKNNTKYKIPDGSTKKMTFIIQGKKPTGTKYDFGVKLKIKIDGRTYFTRCCADPNLGEYILKANLATDNWLFTQKNISV